MAVIEFPGGKSRSKTLDECLEAAILGDADDSVGPNVVDFQVEQANAGAIRPEDATPEQVLKVALRDVRANPGVACYITILRIEDDSVRTTNYTAGMTRTEEVAYRWNGILEVSEKWRGID